METETDKVVAEFMDFRHDYHLSHVHGDDVYSHPTQGWWPVNEPFIKDWNTLMPIVEKIKRLQDKFHFDERGTELINTIDHYVCLVQIKDAQMYIVEFIKWYNNQKENGNRNS